MTTYSKETALYDTGAITTGISEAGETASKYITDIDENGIKIHAEDNANLNYTVIDGDGMEVFQNVDDTAVSVASFGADGARIGMEDASRVEIQPSFFSLLTEEDIPAFSIKTGDSTKMTYVVGTFDKTAKTPVSVNTSHTYILDDLDSVPSGFSFLIYPSVRCTNGRVNVSSSKEVEFTKGTTKTTSVILTSNNAGITVSCAYDGTKTVVFTITNVVTSGDYYPKSYNMSSFKYAKTTHIAEVSIDGDETIDGSLAVEKDVTVYRNLTIKNTAINNIDFGSATLDETAGSSYGNTTINFNTTFDSPPIVVVSLVETINNANVGQTQIGVYSVTTSDFTVRFHNASNYARAFTINWIAIL